MAKRSSDDGLESTDMVSLQDRALERFQWLEAAGGVCRIELLSARQPVDGRQPVTSPHLVAATGHDRAEAANVVLGLVAVAAFAAGAAMLLL